MDTGSEGPGPDTRRDRGLRALAVGLALVGGGTVGEAAWRGGLAERAHQAPPAWTREPPAALRLPPPAPPAAAPPAEAWILSEGRALRPMGAHRALAPTPIEATVHLPPDAELTVWLAAPASPAAAGGVGLRLSRVGEPRATLVQQRDGATVPLGCTGVLPPPGDAPLPVALLLEPGGFTARIAGTEQFCAQALPSAGPALSPGLVPVPVTDLRLGDEAVPSPRPPARPAWWLAGALLGAGLAGLELWLGGAAGVIALTSLPLLLAGALVGLARQGMGWLPTALPLGLALLAKLTHLAGRAVREPPPPPRRDWPLAAAVAALTPTALAWGTEPGRLDPVVATCGGLVVCAGLAVGLVAVLRRLGADEPARAATLLGAATSLGAIGLALGDTPHRLVVAGEGVAALGWSLAVWCLANRRRARAPALVLGAAALLGVVGLEAMARGGRVPTAGPEGPPEVAPPPPPPPAPDGRPLLVAAGGGTSALDPTRAAHWPQRLAEHLGGGVQVVDRTAAAGDAAGVRADLAGPLAGLAPRVVVALLGHDDVLGGGPGASPPGPGALHLLSTLGDALAAARVATGGRPTAWAEAEAAVRGLVADARGRGARVVLVAEGMAPDPGPLRPFHRRLAALAEAEAGVSFLDVAGDLHDGHASRPFVDGCRLSEDGAREVARRVADHLEPLDPW